ncbi:DUF6318 family protein [Cellulomonas sp. CW35]|uniref:DUF6318 family protein n=1 Tax=Cellulomonas sp. CW35 TaxID=3458249 RepID=UPI004033C6C8
MRSTGSWACGLVLVGALALAGCTAEGAAKTATTSSGSSTPAPSATSSPSPTPTPAPTPSGAPTSGPDQDVTKPPTRPAALDGAASEDSAIAVAKYFAALVTYVTSTGEFGEWDALSGDECKFCASVREKAAAIHEAGGRSIGGAVDIGFGSAFDNGDGTFVASVELTEYPSQVVSADGAVLEDVPETATYRATMVLAQGAAGWVVEGVQVDEIDLAP